MSKNSLQQPSTSTTNRSLYARWALVLFLSFLGGLIGRFYGVLVYGVDSDDNFRGFLTGFTISFLVSTFEIFYIRSLRRSWFRKAAFLPGLIIRILVLTLLIRVGLVLNGLLANFLEGQPITVADLEFSKQMRDTLFSLSIVVVFVVLSQLTSIIGFKRFANLVAGRYFKPVGEERIFLFVDLVGSSDLARKLGNVRFHEFLSEFFYTIDQAIVKSSGEIVSYVGDAVIVTWPLLDDKQKNARCLSALQDMLMAVKLNAEQFESEFEVVPQFRAALHGGEVVVGECGDSRKQITFLGDVVNTTARIEDATKREGEAFLVSDFLVQKNDCAERC